jgi:hypothetical protein
VKIWPETLQSNAGQGGGVADHGRLGIRTLSPESIGSSV